MRDLFKNECRLNSVPYQFEFQVCLCFGGQNDRRQGHKRAGKAFPLCHHFKITSSVSYHHHWSKAIFISLLVSGNPFRLICYGRANPLAVTG
jgi:hypothetical protein